MNITPKLAYILGLVWADGFIQYNTIGMHLKASDANDILDIFDDWNYKNKQRENRQLQTHFSIINVDFKNLLSDNGFKSHRDISPDNLINYIPESYKYLWYRGFFDGDGCFYISSNNKIIQSNCSGKISQDWLFLENKLRELDISYTIQRYTEKTGNKWSRIRWTGYTNLIKFGRYIYQNYDNCSMGLTRKYLKYQYVLQLHGDKVISYT